MPNTPENAWQTRENDLAGITRTGTAFRATSLFEANVVETTLQVDGSVGFTQVDQTDVTQSFTNRVFNEILDASDALRIANMKLGTGEPLLDHGAIETVRHVELNSAPFTYDF